MDFCSGWRFKKEGGTWQTVDLPHDAMLTEQRDLACHNGKNTGYFPGGKYCYEKTFSLTEEEAHASVVLLFEGVYRNATVFCNGEKVALHAYGYTQFEADCSAAVRAGENTVRVEVDNSLEPNSRWYSGSGIYRPVHLLLRDRAHITDCRVTTLSLRPAAILVEVSSTNGAPAAVVISDGEEEVYRGEAGTIVLPGAKLWSEEHPHLYRLTASTPTDSREMMFGIRTLEWSAERGLTVNGQSVKLRGCCIHHDNGVIGACAFADAEDRKARIIKQAGYNAVRSAHNPCSTAFLEACDRYGLYVLDEAFDGWYTPKTHHDNGRVFEAEWEGDITAMVLRDRSHPSVIMYSIGNEVMETVTKRGIYTAKRLVAKIKELDATRPVTCGINLTLNVCAGIGLGWYRESKKYIPEPLPPKNSGYREHRSGSAFFNFFMQKLGWIGNIFAKSAACDLAGRNIAAVLDVMGYNYGAARVAKDAKKHPGRIIVSTESLASDLPLNWEMTKKYPAMLGDFVWTGFDYLGEAGIGDWTYYSYSGLPLLAGCGTIDITGYITTQCKFQRVVWGLEKAPVIGVLPPNHAGETPKKSSWRFTDSVESWSWHGMEGKRARIEVYSDAHAVQLFLNGKPVGKKRTKGYIARFEVKYDPGTLTAVALDESGRKISSASLQSGDKNIRLRASAERDRLAANGSDLCYVALEFCNDAGQVLPYVEERIDIRIEGGLTLQGCGSACAKTDERFDRPYVTTYRGRAQCVLRAGRTPGRFSATFFLPTAAGGSNSNFIERRPKAWRGGG